MVKKKIAMPDDIYGAESPGAIQKLTGGAQAPQRPAAPPQTPASPSAGPKATTGPTRNVKPTSFYLTPQQLRKLDDLAYTYNGRTGKRINRNDIIRWLVETCDIGHLQGL